jgi:cytochrome b
MSNATNNEVRVWDPLVRLFHWSLVLTFFISYFTGDEENQLHIYAGYAVLGLIVFRLAWGIIGTKHARFSDFLTSPAKVIAYVKSLFSRKPKHYLGHNPAAGWMVIVLLISLFVTTISGLKLYAVEEGKGHWRVFQPMFI